MTKATKQFKLLLAVFILALCALVTYTAIIPEYNASQYINRVNQAADRLLIGYKSITESTRDTLVYDLDNDPNVSSPTLAEKVESLRNLVRENRVSLARFNAVAKDYAPLPYTGFTDQAKKAAILQKKAVIFAEQSDEAFTQYSQLIDFIKQYDTTEKAIGQYTEEFNSTLDLNTFAGQYDHVRAIAAQIRASAQTLDTAATPHEAMAFKSASVQSFQQLADGFDTVALGLQIPADDVIYSGARQIEAVDQAITVTNHSIYTRDVLSSRTIKSVQELREKLDLIIP